MTTPKNSVKVTEKDLKVHAQNMQALLDKTTWRVRPEQRQVGSYVGSELVESEMSLTKLVKGINPDDQLLTDVELHVLRAIRRGFQFGYHLADEYRKRSGVAEFGTAAGLSDAQKKEYNEKMQTASAVMQFAAARFILWDMHALLDNNAFAGNVTITLDEVQFAGTMMSAKCMMYYLGRNVSQQVDGSDDKLVAVVVGFAEAMQKEILDRAPSFRAVEFFTEVTYQLEETDFTVSGFELLDHGAIKSIEFRRQEIGEITGNRDAKHFARRLATRMLCYCFESGKNPFVELGGFMPVFMGYGIPGTGKSMLIAAIATILHDHCEELGVPFLFHPLPDNIIDSYQGNSARNMVQWHLPMQDRKKLIFAPIDDAENILEERTRKGVSEGVRAAIGVFLRYTEGAYAINHGNAAIGIFTNLPEQLDKAVLSRVQARFAIDGARTSNDLLDQDHLWWRRLEKTDPGFVGMSHPEGYDYMHDQKLLHSMGDIAAALELPSHEGIKEIYQQVATRHDTSEHAFFAELYSSVQKVFPFFSSRDVRNIQSAVDMRLMDFDIPSDWFVNPETYVKQTYERKREMILDLRRSNMGGIDFAGIRREEAIRYLDNMASIAGADFERSVDAVVEQLRVQRAATKWFSNN